jgi:hypothetical protein
MISVRQHRSAILVAGALALVACALVACAIPDPIPAMPAREGGPHAPRERGAEGIMAMEGLMSTPDAGREGIAPDAGRDGLGDATAEGLKATDGADPADGRATDGAAQRDNAPGQ